VSSGELAFSSRSKNAWNFRTMSAFESLMVVERWRGGASVTRLRILCAGTEISIGPLTHAD